MVVVVVVVVVVVEVVGGLDGGVESGALSEMHARNVSTLCQQHSGSRAEGCSSHNPRVRYGQTCTDGAGIGRCMSE